MDGVALLEAIAMVQASPFAGLLQDRPSRGGWHRDPVNDQTDLDGERLGDPDGVEQIAQQLQPPDAGLSGQGSHPDQP